VHSPVNRASAARAGDGGAARAIVETAPTFRFVGCVRMSAADVPPHAMRLVHQTFLLLLAAVLVTVAAMAGLFAFGLERGFVAYINARQQEQVAGLERLVADEVQRSGSLERLREDPRAWRRMLARASPAAADFAADSTEPAAAPPPPEATEGDPAAAPFPPGRPPPGQRGARPPRPRGDRPPAVHGIRPPRPAPEDPPRAGPPPADPYGGGGRIDLLAADRTPVFAPPQSRANAGTPVLRAVSIDARTVAWLRWWPLQRVDRPEDIAFLEAQYARIGWIAGGLMLLMAGIAPLVARRVTRPLRAIAAATARIAHGEFDVRLETSRGDEIGALMRNVDTMAASLGQLERARRRWVAEIAHELRTPLTVLQGELEALADGVRPLDARAIASLHDETRHLARLVDDLHQLALADLGALPCTMAAMDLGAVVRRVAERLRERATGKGLALEVVAPEAPLALNADAQRIGQLVANLIENSVRYTDAPGRIVVRVEGNRDAATVCVEDTAPGVTAAECGRLFDPLYRADAARSRKSGGSGLGLAIARAIAAAHGGEIRAEPAAMGGLAVVVTLRRHR
jgi:two-component system sensor histidine kinase BaeS